jgi:hypothetical protein
MTTVYMTRYLRANSIIASPSVANKKLHGHHLWLLTCHGYLFYVLIIIFQLGPKMESMCFIVE